MLSKTQHWRNRYPEKAKAQREKFYRENCQVAAKLGVLTRHHPNYSCREWRQEEIAVLRDNRHLTAEELAQLLGTRSPKAVGLKRGKMGYHYTGGKVTCQKQ